MAALTSPAPTLEKSLDFASLVQAHQAMVYSLAYRFLHDDAAAEEVAQEVFLLLHRKLREIQSAEHALFWLRRVTAQRCIDCARRRRRRSEVPLADVPEPAAEPTAADPWRTRHLRSLVASLPEKARLVILLRYQEDLDPEDIAAVLALPVNTVKSRLQRALAMLRQKAGGTTGER